MEISFLPFMKYHTEKYCIAVRTKMELLQRYSITRSVEGDVYFNFLGSEPEHAPHNSKHASGISHHKSYGHKIFVKSGQKPNADYKGAETIASTSISSTDTEAIHLICNPSEYSEIMEIPESLVSSGQAKLLSVDIVEPGEKPWVSTDQHSRVLRQKIFKQQVPWIVVSLYEMSLIPANN